MNPSVVLREEFHAAAMVRALCLWLCQGGESLDSAMLKACPGVGIPAEHQMKWDTVKGTAQRDRLEALETILLIQASKNSQ